MIFSKERLLSFLSLPVFSSFWNSIYPDFSVILTFHRVAPIDHNRIPGNDHLKVSPPFFESMLKQFLRKGWKFISLDELNERIMKRLPLKKLAVLTFDDGYLDNLENAYPIMKDLKVPGMIYLSTGLMHGEALPWWNILEDYLLTHAEIEFQGVHYRCNTPVEKENVFLEIRKAFMRMIPTEIRTACLEFFPESVLKKYTDVFIPLNMLSQYSEDSPLSFGSHTHMHLTSSNLSKEILEKDIEESIRILKMHGQTIRHFAFPYGDDLGSADFLKPFFQRMQIQTAVTTFSGLVFHRTNPLFLPRFFVSEYNPVPLGRQLHELSVLEKTRKMLYRRTV